MTRGSLRLRLVLAGGAAVLVALAIAAIGLAALFERHVQRRAVEELSADLDQLSAGIERGPDGALVIAAPPADARYRQPLSGHYWQVETAAGPLVSRSLWDALLKLPADVGPFGALHTHLLEGPGGESLLVVDRRLALPGDGAEGVRAAVALDRAELREASRDFLRDLVPYLALLAAALIAAGWAMVVVGLRPLARVGARVAAVRSGEATRLGDDFPVEVQPLAAEVDALIAAREKDVAAARARASDLAHGLKTPLQALIGEASRLAERGEREAAEGIEEIATAMLRHVSRELTRARLAGPDWAGAADAAGVIEGLLAVLRRTPDGARIDWQVDLPRPLSARIETGDLTEALGAVLENAARHAASRVHVTATRAGQALSIRIRDDGPGVEQERLGEITQRGLSLGGTDPDGGLGLAIAAEICAAAGGSIALRNAEPGLEVTLRLRAAAAPST